MAVRRRLIYLVLVVLLAVACGKSAFRIRTFKPKEDRNKNLEEAAKDSADTKPKKDTLSREVQVLKEEQFNFLTNLIINNMVRAQQAAYDGRYEEAEKLLLQTLKWYPTSDALLLLGSVYEVKGNTRAADSCWMEARRIDPEFDARTSELPRQRKTEEKKDPKPTGK